MRRDAGATAPHAGPSITSSDAVPPTDRAAEHRGSSDDSNERTASSTTATSSSKRIGRGGMADVFLARDLLLDRPVAIKVLFPEFAVDPNFVERFRREAQAAANLNHPNIVSVYDWGKHASTYFMAMEYVEGRTLADILRANGQLTLEAGGRDRQRGRRRARLRPPQRRGAPRHQAGQHPHRHQRPGEGGRLRHRPGHERAHRAATSPRPAR